MERKRVQSFEDLLVWQKGIEFAKQIYVTTAQGQLHRDFGLRDQIQRAAVSIPTNIAEGFERGAHKEYLQYLKIAKGSAGEIRSLLCVAFEVGYLNQTQYNQLRSSAVELSCYLANQIRSLREAGV
jgi:four helix bundle protein